MAIKNGTQYFEHLQLKYKTKAQWDAEGANGSDYILAAGELGLELDTKKFKLGDGVKKWSELDYYSDPVLQGLVEALTSRVSQTETDIADMKSRLEAIEGVTTISVNDAPADSEPEPGE